MPAARSLIQRLRATAVGVVDGPPQRLPGTVERYRQTDGTTFRLRTAAEGRLITNAAGFATDDVMDLERGDEDSIVIAVLRDDGKVDVYQVPKSVVVGDMRENHTQHLAVNPDAESKVRNINFSGDPTRPGYGFCVRYARYLLDTVELAGIPEPPAAEVTLEANLQGLMQELARKSADYLEQPVDRVRISIGVLLDTGEMTFHWRPSPIE